MKKFIRYNKTFKLLMVLGMFLSMLMPTGGMTVEAVGGKDLGNIFTFESLKINDQEAVEGQIVNIKDSTSALLSYTWDTKGKDAKAGDYAEIEIPDAFKLGEDFESKEIKLSDNTVVGEYSLKSNKIRFVFNENINKGAVKNGTVGFGLKFEETVFSEEVVQEIKFNDTSEKVFTIIGQPTESTNLISKSGIPNSEINPNKINWTIDIANPSEDKIENAKFEDLIPTGLKLDVASIKVTSLNVGLDGSLYGSETSTEKNVTPKITDLKLEMPLGEIKPFKGLRVKYSTLIDPEYKGKPIYTNEATFIKDGTNHPAAATVTIGKSKGVEKHGSVEGDVISWWIDVNKNQQVLNNAVLSDTLPTGTTLIENTLKVYKLNLNEDKSKWIQSDKEITDANIKTIDKDKKSFKVEFKGESSEVYRVRFDAKINYDGNYIRENKFKNTAKLMPDIDDDKTLEAEHTITTIRKPLLEKFGSQNIVAGMEEKTITWTIYVNEAKHTIKDPIITDTIPQGLKISEEDITIKDSKGVDVKNEFKIEVPASDGTTATTLKIQAKDGEINDTYTIEYKTTITDFAIEEFKNSVELAGTGVGTPKKVETPIKPNTNQYNKNFKSIDYNEKTMTWSIKVNPVKESIKELKITDTFPNKGMFMLEDSIEVKLGSKIINTTKSFVEPYYKIFENTADGETNYNKGFIIKFFNISDNPINELLTINFKTSYDPAEIPEEDVHLGYKSEEKTLNYINKAKFEGETNSNLSINKDSDASHTIKLEAWNSGKKVAKLKSVQENGDTVDGWISGNTRKIKWEVYINYNNQELPKTVQVEDELKYDGQIEKESIKVYKYSVNANGTTEIGEELNKDQYIYKVDENGKKLILTFNNEINERYVVRYTTTVPDISLAEYTNNAIFKAGSKSYPLKGSIKYSKNNNNLSKKALEITKDSVHTDDQLNWEIKVNEALSVIKEAKVVDTISVGQIFKKDTFKINSKEGETFTPLVEDVDYTLKVSSDNLGESETNLTVEFTDKINTEIYITYTTVVIAEYGEIYNNVTYDGTGITTVTKESKRLKASLFSYVGGEWDPDSGKIIINKIDSTEKNQ